MKKLITLLLIYFIVQPAFAAGVGYINYEKIFNNYKYAQNVAKDLQAREKAASDYFKQKEDEYNKLESPVKRQQFEAIVKVELQKKETEFLQYKEQKENDVYNRIHAVVEKIRLEKQLDAIWDARCVFTGGVDITDEVIKKLNENIR